MSQQPTQDPSPASRRSPRSSAAAPASLLARIEPVAQASQSLHPRKRRLSTDQAPEHSRRTRPAPAMADESGSWRTGAASGEAPSGGSSWGHGAAAAAPAAAAASSGGRRNGGGRNARGGPAAKRKAAPAPSKPMSILPAPSHTIEYLRETYARMLGSSEMKPAWLDNPKSPVQNHVMAMTGANPKYEVEEGHVEGRREKTYRATLVVHQQPEVIAYGDARSAKDAEKVAALHALLLLVERRLLGSRPPPGVAKAAAASSGAAAAAAQPTVQLSDKTMLTAERAREFMEYYCKKFNFGKPDILLSQGTQQKGRRQVQAGWEAEMAVGGRRIGMAQGSNKKVATSNVYLDTVKYLESCDPELWRQFDMTHKPGAPVGSAPHVYFRISDELDDELRAVYQDTRQSMLYAKRPRLAGVAQPGEARSELVAQKPRDQRRFGGPGAASEEVLKQKSARLLADLDAYQTADRVKAIREQRHSLPVQQKAGDVLVKIELNQVTIVMAATGSGKTTQIPQMLFDDYILRGEGAKCNIFCTQPRRIAAISVAQRVAKERGERVGETVGYQVRFEAKTPQPNGSITFCTTGVFLRRLQSALGDSNASNSFLDSLTHIVVDEVHERDVETDLLLVVIKRLLAERKRMGKKEIKLVLMSATIDPTLFQNYFTEPPPSLKPAPVVEVPGRSFPVDKHYLEETIAHLQSQRLTHRDGAWVFQEKNVRDYLERELNQGGGIVKRVINGAPGAEAEASDAIDDLELPYPLISLMIADVINRSDDGHVLVFMPGWEEIKAVNTILQDTRSRPLLGLDFNDSSRFEVHILHSSIPVAEQQAVFDPPRDPSIRRIILSTNIAETSVTIPDVVYVVDTGRVKEKRYDPERHLSSLVSAWVGTSNLNQRAGRAGRHRPGEYYGVLSKARYDQLNVNQTVEMKRTDLSNVVMHIKALDIPGMEVEDVLDAAIEPPAPERVRAAMEKLFMVGALDQSKALTSLGHVLLQLPVDAAMGKMCLYGAFFRCLDPTLTLAAVLTNRDPFMAPMALKREADAVKDSWCPPDFRSDALTVLRAYTHWWDMQGRGDYQAANRFCSDNFLSKITLLQIQQVKEHLFSSLEKAGIIDVTLGSAASARAPAPRAHGVPTGPASRMRSHLTETSPELNVNSGSTPLLAALIALASTPNFAIRSSEKVFRTSQDKACFIHPSSVCHLKHTKNKESENTGERELLAFSEKIRNVSMVTAGGGNSNPQTNLRGVTRLDPLTYMLFGANQVSIADGGIYCDEWLPVRGHFESLDDVERLKGILDVCMLRVMEGCTHVKRGPRRIQPQRQQQPKRWGEDDDDAIEGEHAEDGAVDAYGDRSDLSLAPQEIEEFERLTSGIVGILDHYAHERSWNASRGSTRPATPQGYGGGSGPGSAYGGAYGGVPNGGGGAYGSSGSGYNSPYSAGPPMGNSGGAYTMAASSLGLSGARHSHSGPGSAYNSRPGTSGSGTGPSSGPSALGSWRRGGA